MNYCWVVKLHCYHCDWQHAQKCGLVQLEFHKIVIKPHLFGPLFSWVHGSFHGPLKKIVIVDRLSRWACCWGWDPLDGQNARHGHDPSFTSRQYTTSTVKLHCISVLKVLQFCICSAYWGRFTTEIMFWKADCCWKFYLINFKKKIRVYQVSRKFSNNKLAHTSSKLSSRTLMYNETQEPTAATFRQNTDYHGFVMLVSYTHAPQCCDVGHNIQYNTKHWECSIADSQLIVPQWTKELVYTSTLVLPPGELVKSKCKQKKADRSTHSPDSRSYAFR